MQATSEQEYPRNLEQLRLYLEEGAGGVSVVNNRLQISPWKEYLPCDSYRKQEAEVKGLIREIVWRIIDVHRAMHADSPHFSLYFTSHKVVKMWNERESNQKIPFAEQIQIAIPSLPEAHFSCFYLNEKRTPLVITPKNSSRLEGFQQWAQKHRSEMTRLLAQHGALLLRGFPVTCAEEFAATLKSIFGRDLMSYHGDGSRTKICEGVYTSTEAPPRFRIPLHNELSYTNAPPAYICFYCDTAPSPESGQTSLGKTSSVTGALREKASVWELFKERRIKYISTHPPESSYYPCINSTHKTWQSAFETKDRKEVERICTAKGIAFRWLGEWLEITSRTPALKVVEGGSYWFNQAHLFHQNPRLRGGWVNHLLANLLYSIPSTRQYGVEFDDGTPIPQEAIYTIYDALERETVLFNWKQGDVLLVDNIEMLHGREPYSGQRRILTAML